MQLEMTLIDASGATPLPVEIRSFVIAGWAGRDHEAMEHHIQELEALGIKRPEKTPTFYRVGANRLTISEEIECSGTQSSGEAETLIIAQDGELFVGLGSDHTDRHVETFGVTVSKQICDKPIADTVWRFEEVAGYWDQLELHSWLTTEKGRVQYQHGTVAGLLAPQDLIALYTDGEVLPDGTAMMGGTLPAIGGVRPGSRFDCALVDPVLSRRIELSYAIVELPIAG